jgi:hypothetical protein
MTASWAATPLCGSGLWQILVTSPEVLVFAFFMLSDPKTVPVSPLNRVLFGLAVGFFSALLLGPTGTEFWTKTALLASLVVACAIRFPLARLTQLPWGVRAPGAAVAGALCLALLPLSTAIPAHNPQLVAWLPGETTATAAITPQVVVGPGPGVAAGLSQVALSALPAIPGSLPQPSAGSSYVWKTSPLTIVIPKDVTDFDPNLTPSLALTRANNLVVDLNIEAEARRQRDPTLASTGASGDGLTPFTALISSDRAAGHVVSTTYSFNRANLVLLLPKFKTQAPRLVGTALVGFAHLSTYDGGGTLLSSQDVPYTQIWELTPNGDRYLITNDYTGLTPAP